MNTILDWLEHTAAADPNKVAFEDPKGSITWGALREQAEGSADSGQDPSASEKNGGTECTEKTADDTEQRKD